MGICICAGGGHEGSEPEMMEKHFIPTSSYECAKYNNQSLDPCLHCEECSVLERTLHKKCKEKELYDYYSTD